MIRPRPRAVPGTGRRPGGGAGSVIAGHSRTPGVRASPGSRGRVRSGSGRGLASGILSRSTPLESKSPCGRWNRHHHRRRGRQGPRPRHPEPLRRPGRWRGRDDRGHQHGVLARARGGRAVPRRLRRARRQARPPAPRGDPAAGQRRDGGPMAVRDATGIFLTGGNQLRLSSTIGGTLLADAILDRFQARRRGGRHVGRRIGDVEPHDRVRGVGRDAQAPDGPDRGRARGPPRRHHRPAFPAAEPARAAAQPDRPEPEPARARRRRGHRRRGRPRPRHGGDRARLDHGGRRLASPRPTPGRSTGTGR